MVDKIDLDYLYLLHIYHFETSTCLIPAIDIQAKKFRTSIFIKVKRVGRNPIFKLNLFQFHANSVLC